MNAWRLAALGLAAALCFAPAPARADEPVREVTQDPGVYPSESTRLPLLFAGLGTTAAWYGAAAGSSLLWPDAPGARALRVPVAGPWMALADTGCAANDPGCSTVTVVLRAILTTMAGVGQAGGLAVMAESLFLPTYAEAPAAPRRARPRLQRGAALELEPVPVVGAPGSIGLGLAGRF
ncbi:MAG: hypothetical protein OZ921_16470 [Sorangiineae bacterium]|nr:hypothetical protein [Polyangiaceae bacterium]MEB2324109.1 hypothetical protein [Sorangiineae bacterium]